VVILLSRLFAFTSIDEGFPGLRNIVPVLSRMRTLFGGAPLSMNLLVASDAERNKILCGIIP
jgi:hypothetical protein